MEYVIGCLALTGAADCPMFCIRDLVKVRQSSEQKGSDSSLANGQIASEVNQLAVGSFLAVGVCDVLHLRPC